MTWLWDLTADSLDVQFTIDDLMDDLEYGWGSTESQEVEQR